MSPKPKFSKIAPVLKSQINFVNPSQINSRPEMAIRNKMLLHKAILNASGVGSISKLGVMKISGNVKPQNGLRKPSTNINVSDKKDVIYSNARVFNSKNKRFEVKAGGAKILLAERPVPQLNNNALLIQIIPYDRAYWVAETIEISSDTNVVLDSSVNNLVIIAENIIVGNNVTFTYEESPIDAPPKPDKPATKPTGGWDGEIGKTGKKGNKGSTGRNAPKIEIWTINFSGPLNVYLKGQNGGQGGMGQDGGDGGNGANGKDSEPAFLNCKGGPFSGRPGGKGGKAGDGGDGGIGGYGGDFDLYCSQTIINQIVTSGFYISIDGGSGGVPGGPGIPGNGGKGGLRGNINGYCANSFFNWDDRVNGLDGPNGDVGIMGIPGEPGIKISGATISFNPIDQNDFFREFTEPHITLSGDRKAFVGETVNVYGENLSNSDVIIINNIVAVTMPISSTLCQFVVPNIEGGFQSVYIKQSDGTKSNLDSLYIKAQIDETLSDKRITPGTEAIIKGKGFSQGLRVMLNNENVQNVTFVNKETIKYGVVRPSGVLANPEGELADLKLVDPTGYFYSNNYSVTIDTFRMLCFGDSIMAGQGLSEPFKFYGLVESFIRSNNGNIGVYNTSKAHSGAIIGKGNQGSHDPYDPEVPTAFPTIIEQVGTMVSIPDAAYVDLILVNGGINDIGFSLCLEPSLNSDDQISRNNEIINLTRKYCFDDMKYLLELITNSFPKAKVIVTGYYPFFSMESRPLINLVKFFLMGLSIPIPTLALEIGCMTDLAFNSIASQCLLMSNEMNNNLLLSVNETNNNLNTTRVYFANPNFGLNNAAYAPDPWIFATDELFNLQDYQIAHRTNVCSIYPADNGETFCRHASIGHPNLEGSMAYFNAIKEYL